MAQKAEAIGMNRFWMAEHHNMPGIASAATSVLLSHIGAKTNKIRIGSGGVMLPNHAPLVIAEQFGTLQALYGDRIDLGLRPGTWHRWWPLLEPFAAKCMMLIASRRMYRNLCFS